MFRFGIIKWILIASLIAVVAFPVYGLVYVFPAFEDLLVDIAERDATLLAEHIQKMLTKTDAELTKASLPPDFGEQVGVLLDDFDIERMKVFAADGEVIFSTDARDVGKINKESYFREYVARGRAFSKAVRKETPTLEGQLLAVDTVETYVPVMRAGKFLGAFEIYYNITARMEKLSALLIRTYEIIGAMLVFMLSALAVSAYKTYRTITALNRAEKRIIDQSRQLEEFNAELSVLYGFSATVSRKIELDELLTAALNAVTEIEAFRLERKGGIMLVEGDKMRIAAHLGHSQEFLDLHRDMKVGDCLCGLSAMTGETIVSEASACDPRHTITYPGMTPHGHIIVPLKSMYRLIGVLYLCLPAGFELDERKLKILSAIGSLLATAVENSKLYEDTKALSLHDPMTGLANRRLMEPTAESLIAIARRYGSPLCALMLDIDHFKRYNDTHGHQAGDRLLTDIGDILRTCIREADLAARYGGEEFLVLLPRTELETAVETAERVRQTVEAKTAVTISIGVSNYEGSMGAEDLIGQADKALYRAKQNGRNRVETYGPH